VAVIPRSSAKLAQWLRTAACQDDGRFDFADLHPGEYSILAFDRIADTSHLADNTFMDSVAGRAELVQLKPGENKRLELRLTMWPD
jgi:hypothetical protein